MRIFRCLCRILAVPLAVVFLFASLPFNVANAGLVTTDRVLTQESGSADRARVHDFLDRKDVRNQLGSLGVDPDEAKRRIDSLSDEEVRRIAGKIDTMPAGEGALEAVLIAAIVIFLVLIITDLLGVTDVFPFIRPARVR